MKTLVKSYNGGNRIGPKSDQRNHTGRIVNTAPHIYFFRTKLKQRPSKCTLRRRKKHTEAQKAWDCTMKNLCYSLHEVAGAVRKPNVSQRGINKKAAKQRLGFVMVGDQILAGRRKKLCKKKEEASETLIKLFT